MSTFPASKDTLPTNSSNTTPDRDVHPELHNHVNDTLNAVQTALLPGGPLSLGDHMADPAAHAGIGAHTHPESQVTNLETDLAARAASSHTHTEANVTNLETDLAGKAASVHTHTEANITGLTTDLSNKASSTHTHTRSFEFYVPFKGPVVGDDGGQFEINAATSITAVRAVRVGGTAATIDVKKNGVSILTVPTAPGTSYTAGILTTNPTSFAVNDLLVVSVASLTGSPTEVDVKVIGTQATGAPQ